MLCHPGYYMPFLLCLALTFYYSSPPFSSPEENYNLSCALSLRPPPPSPSAPSFPHPFYSFFFSLLPTFKVYALLPALAESGQREQNNGRLSVSQPSFEGWVGGRRGGYWLLVFLSTVNSNGLMQRAYYRHVVPHWQAEKGKHGLLVYSYFCYGTSHLVVKTEAEASFSPLIQTIISFHRCRQRTGTKDVQVRG